MNTRRRWQQRHSAKNSWRLRYAPPFVWYQLRPEYSSQEPAFRIERAARALGPEDGKGHLWLLDRRGAARYVPAEHFLRQEPPGAWAAPGGVRFSLGGKVVSAFLIDGVWQLAIGGRIWLTGPLMTEGEHPSTILAKLCYWAEQIES